MNKPPTTQFPTTSATQDIKPARGRGQQPPHPMGTETIEHGRNAYGRLTSTTLSTPILFVKFAIIDAHSMCQHAINAVIA